MEWKKKAVNLADYPTDSCLFDGISTMAPWERAKILRNDEWKSKKGAKNSIWIKCEKDLRKELCFKLPGFVSKVEPIPSDTSIVSNFRVLRHLCCGVNCSQGLSIWGFMSVVAAQKGEVLFSDGQGEVEPFGDYPCSKIVKNETTLTPNVFWKLQRRKCALYGHSLAHTAAASRTLVSSPSAARFYTSKKQTKKLTPKQLF